MPAAGAFNAPILESWRLWRYEQQGAVGKSKFAGRTSQFLFEPSSKHAGGIEDHLTNPNKAAGTPGNFTMTQQSPL